MNADTHSVMYFSSPADALPAGLKDKLDKYVQSYADSGLFSGVVMVRSGKETLFLKAAGVADRSFGVPVDADHIYQFCVAALRAS